MLSAAQGQHGVVAEAGVRVVPDVMLERVVVRSAWAADAPSWQPTKPRTATAEDRDRCYSYAGLANGRRSAVPRARRCR
jgi:hypothetical protein